MKTYLVTLTLATFTMQALSLSFSSLKTSAPKTFGGGFAKNREDAEAQSKTALANCQAACGQESKCYDVTEGPYSLNMIQVYSCMDDAQYKLWLMQPQAL